MTSLKLTIDIEPVVKVKCQNWDCKHFIETKDGRDHYPKYGYCKLKHITIGRDVDNLTAFCEDREVKD